MNLDRQRGAVVIDGNARYRQEHGTLPQYREEQANNESCDGNNDSNMRLEREQRSWVGNTGGPTELPRAPPMSSR